MASEEGSFEGKENVEKREASVISEDSRMGRKRVTAIGISGQEQLIVLLMQAEKVPRFNHVAWQQNHHSSSLVSPDWRHPASSAPMNFIASISS
eukprot:g57540.t1